MMPLVENRPLTLVRCPNGASQHCFFQKHAKVGVPKAIHRVPIEEDDGEAADYMAIDDRDGLLAAVQLGSLELHTWGCHTDKPEKPDLLVMDLDPDPSVPFARSPESPGAGGESMPQQGCAVAAEIVAAGARPDLEFAGPRLVFAWTTTSLAANAAADIGAESASCPHGGGPPTCWCRPPLPGLLLAFANRHRLDPRGLVVIGTSTAHRTMALAVGARFVPHKPPNG